MFFLLSGEEERGWLCFHTKMSVGQYRPEWWFGIKDIYAFFPWRRKL